MQSFEEVLRAPLEEISDSEKNGLLSAVIEAIYPTGENNYAVQFREFDNDDAQLIIEVVPDRTEVISVEKRMASNFNSSFTHENKALAI